ncbi:TIGR03767 family metallophosphoesterase, partial [Streptomyces mirabilis]
MSRIRSVATSAAMNRRTLLAATGAVTLSAGIGYALPPDSEAHAATTDTGESAVAVSLPHSRLRSSGGTPMAPAAPLAPYERGTTLESVAAPRSGSGDYRRL